MPNEIRLYENFVGGTLTQNLGPGVTTMQSTALAALPIITSTDHIMLTINPNGLYGELPEIVKVISHSAFATDAQVVRAQEGTVEGNHLASNNVTWHMGLVKSDALSFHCLGFTNYTTNSLFSVTGTTLTDASAANLVVTFSAPPSGKVVVELTGVNEVTGGATNWGLREGSTQIGLLQGMGTAFARLTAKIFVTGLTPGNLHTWKWAFANTDPAQTSRIYIGGNGNVPGAATMEVRAINR